MKTRLRPGLLIAAITIATALFTTPTQATASNAFVTAGDLRFSAAAGETNDLTISRTGATYILSDPGAPVTPLGACAAVTANIVTCPAAGVTGSIRVQLKDLDDRLVIADTLPALDEMISAEGGDGDDTITSTGSNEINAHGGAGNDLLITGPGRDRLDGDEGNDTVTANGGGDRLDGGPGDDLVNGGPGSDQFETGDEADGADTFTGGAGKDEANYGQRINGVTITPDGTADDGEAGEGDNIGADVEDLTGGDGPDDLTGNGSDSEIRGVGGNDSLAGGGGSDDLSGGDGDDTVNGGPGDDEIRGNEGADTLHGDAGTDSFRFEAQDDSPDQILGGGGLDTYADGSIYGLAIDLDGVADDGYRNPAEGQAIDNIGADIENLIADHAADVLVGNGSANVIDGGWGNDRISGLGGPDALFGGAGDDQLDGGKGIDEIEGAGGSDRIRSRDRHPDEVSCGSSVDELLADFRDWFTVACDRVSTGVSVRPKRAKLNRRGKARLRVNCPALEGIACKVRIVAKRGRKALARGRGKVRSGASGKVTIRLTRAGKKRRARKLALRARVTFTDATGTRVSTTIRRLVLKR